MYFKAFPVTSFENNYFMLIYSCWMKYIAKVFTKWWGLLKSMTSFWYVYSLLKTDFAHSSAVFIVTLSK